MKLAIAALPKPAQQNLIYDWQFWGRENQQTPPGTDWETWLLLAGRGFGKSRTGAEWVIGEVKSGRRKRLALIARTAADVRDVVVEGESGILAKSPPWFMPVYEPSKRRLTWPNGAIATTYSAEKPDALRGPQHDGYWGDETASWKYAEDTWDNLQFGLRLGKHPQGVVTTTPRPVKLIKNLIKDPKTFITKGSTYVNKGNLPKSFLSRLLAKYEGTRLGRQELYAQLLEDTPGALWTLARIELLRVKEAPPLVRIVVGVDPAISANKESAETGIVVVGIDIRGHLYILADVSLQGTPAEWASAAIKVYSDFQADAIVVETNQGGLMVEHTIRTVEGGKDLRIIQVHASRGKYTRAEPISALYEQGRAHHVGALSELEDQMTTWTPGEDSPDRMDALVWGCTQLTQGGAIGDIDEDATNILFRGYA